MIPRLSCLTGTSLGTGKWVPHIYVVSMEDQTFLEAHGVKQWWSNDSNGELKHGNPNNKLLSMQLKYLNASTPSQVVLFYYPRYVSLATSCLNIREASGYVWISILKRVPRHMSGKAQINNDGDLSSGIGLVSWNWIPSLSGLKDTGYWVCKWIPRMYVGAEEKMVGKENMDPKDGQVSPKLLVFSKL